MVARSRWISSSYFGTCLSVIVRFWVKWWRYKGSRGCLWCNTLRFVLFMWFVPFDISFATATIYWIGVECREWAWFSSSDCAPHCALPILPHIRGVPPFLYLQLCLRPTLSQVDSHRFLLLKFFIKCRFYIVSLLF